MDQQIRFCTSSDGVRLAYAEVGEGPPLVAVFTWVSNLQMDWEHPQSRAWVQRVARNHRFIRFDRRGAGTSQREISDFSISAQVSDLATLVDHLQLDKFALWGFEDGAPISTVYAAEHPERVSQLILWEAFAVGAELTPAGTIPALINLVRENWGMARRSIANTVFPTGPVEMQRWMSNVLRETYSPEAAIKYLELQSSIDITSYLPRVQAPTLVIQRRGDRLVPQAASRAAAAAIPDARYAQFDGDIGYLYYGEADHLKAVEEFLQPPKQQLPASPAGPVRTVLFTDLVGHTEMMARLGDEAGRAVLREHERITRDVLKQHGGDEIKTMGDGFMASFGSVTKAVECAIALQRAFAKREGEPLSIRVGLNAGEPIEEDGDLFGATVILASRIAAKAGAGEILVADTVRGLCSGKGFLFSDRGEFVPKGFEEPMRVCEVNWQT